VRLKWDSTWYLRWLRTRSLDHAFPAIFRGHQYHDSFEQIVGGTTLEKLILKMMARTLLRVHGENPQVFVCCTCTQQWRTCDVTLLKCQCLSLWDLIGWTRHPEWKSLSYLPTSIRVCSLFLDMLIRKWRLSHRCLFMSWFHHCCLFHVILLLMLGNDGLHDYLCYINYGILHSRGWWGYEVWSSLSRWCISCSILWMLIYYKRRTSWNK
jgi:hypothetical protein